ncbi:hypothetical protein OF83DRAFT_730366 [Amylostereum chailletii]|nr:hypothetical protein OF83DRAFT_730366 [Amylostereum chailletii]
MFCSSKGSPSHSRVCRCRQLNMYWCIPRPKSLVRLPLGAPTRTSEFPLPTPPARLPSPTTRHEPPSIFRSSTPRSHPRQRDTNPPPFSGHPLHARRPLKLDHRPPPLSAKLKWEIRSSLLEPPSFAAFLTWLPRFFLFRKRRALDFVIRSLAPPPLRCQCQQVDVPSTVYGRTCACVRDRRISPRRDQSPGGKARRQALLRTRPHDDIGEVTIGETCRHIAHLPLPPRVRMYKQRPDLSRKKIKPRKAGLENFGGGHRLGVRCGRRPLRSKFWKTRVEGAPLINTPPPPRRALHSVGLGRGCQRDDDGPPRAGVRARWHACRAGFRIPLLSLVRELGPASRPAFRRTMPK